MGKFLALLDINARLTWENNSNRKQIFVLALSTVVLWRQAWRNACSLSGISEIEDSGDISRGLQTLNLSLSLCFSKISSFFSLSKSLQSVLCHGSVYKVRV